MTTAMKPKRNSKPTKTAIKPEARMDDDSQPTAGGRWSSVHRVRLPYKVGLPLSSGGGGDAL